MSLNIPTQSVFLYKGKWTSRIDDLLITTTMRVKCDHPWPGSEVPSRVVFEVGSVVEKELGVKFTLLELSHGYLVVEQRYLTFKQVVAWLGTSWLTSVKLVVADDSLWKKIFQVHPFVTAYYHRDEPEFYKLVVLFGWDVVKAEGMHDTIVILDSVEDVQQPNIVNENVADESGEANSPLLKATAPVRRQLFCDDVNSLDHESTNVPRKYDHIPSADGGLAGRNRNSLPRRPIWASPATNHSPGVKSTASWSPFAAHQKNIP
ncbi:hypothetical protein AAHA92_22425 [Salvia divinorum]|uniref:Uncharacterized protein n=1 Tax=Salvia divinorum TaxID=28513 RepID=A0ABD1GNN1_SALDI